MLENNATNVNDVDRDGHTALDAVNTASKGKAKCAWNYKSNYAEVKKLNVDACICTMFLFFSFCVFSAKSWKGMKNWYDCYLSMEANIGVNPFLYNSIEKIHLTVFVYMFQELKYIEQLLKKVRGNIYRTENHQFIAQ